VSTSSATTRGRQPPGPLCANGQCSSAWSYADGRPVRPCMTPRWRAGMAVQSVEGLPRCPRRTRRRNRHRWAVTPDVLIVAAARPACRRAIELGKLGRAHPGGRRQGPPGRQARAGRRHKFFGSVEDSHAGTARYEIGEILAAEIARYPSWRSGSTPRPWPCSRTGSSAWCATAATSPSSRRSYGGHRRTRRRKMLSPFPGNTAPRGLRRGLPDPGPTGDLVKSSERVLIVGGGATWD